MPLVYIYFFCGDPSSEKLLGNSPNSLNLRSEFLRNILLGLAAILALPFAVWKNVTSDKAAATAQKSYDNETYAKALEHLASDKESIQDLCIIL